MVEMNGLIAEKSEFASLGRQWRLEIINPSHHAIKIALYNADDAEAVIKAHRKGKSVDTLYETNLSSKQTVRIAGLKSMLGEGQPRSYFLTFFDPTKEAYRYYFLRLPIPRTTAYMIYNDDEDTLQMLLPEDDKTPSGLSLINNIGFLKPIK